MVTAKQILTEIYVSEDFAAMITKIKPVHLQDDIRQHIFCELLLKDEAFILGLNERKEIRRYIAQMAWNISRLRASNSFTKQLGLREQPTDGFKDVAYETEELFFVPLNQIHWYKAKVIELYAEMGSYSAVAKHTGIPASSIFRTVRQARKEIKKLI